MRRLIFYVVVLAGVVACSPADSDNNEASIAPGEDASNVPDTSSDLSETHWLLVDLAGQQVSDGVESTLSFAEGSLAAGSGGCNRFSGSYDQAGSQLSFGMMISTRMACPGPQMDQESRFLNVLATVEAFSISPEGHLLLHPPEGTTPSRLTPTGGDP